MNGPREIFTLDELEFLASGLRDMSPHHEMYEKTRLSLYELERRIEHKKKEIEEEEKKKENSKLDKLFDNLLDNFFKPIS